MRVSCLGTRGLGTGKDRLHHLIVLNDNQRHHEDEDLANKRDEAMDRRKDNEDDAQHERRAGDVLVFLPDLSAGGQQNK